MQETGTATYDQSYTDYQLNRGWLRKSIRNLYIKNACSYCTGRTIDFGCGVGTILKKLPSGSIGLEVNPATVNYCKHNSLNVELYEPETDQYQFKFAQPGTYNSLIISHVLEHLNDPDKILKAILDSCIRLGIKKAVIIVPGIKGYKSDKTHCTFIDEKYLESKGLLSPDKWKITTIKRFPFNSALVGKYFTHNELIVVYEAK